MRSGSWFDTLTVSRNVLTFDRFSRQTMTGNAALEFLVLRAVLLALGYFPAVTKLSKGLVSPYPKADVRRRLSAAAIDGLTFITCLGAGRHQS